MTSKAVARWFEEMPREEEMLAKDKYTIFDRKEKKYRKGIHSMLHAVFFVAALFWIILLRLSALAFRR